MESAKMMKKLLPAFLLIVASVVAVSAQASPEQAIRGARDEFFNIKNRSIELERMKKEADKRPVSKDSTQKFPKIKEDFEQIQKVNSAVFKLTTLDEPLDYAAVLKFVSEVNRRAARLRSNLFPAEQKTKNTEHTALAPLDLKILLYDLDKAVNSFVHNSMFQNANLVNSQDSLKAQKDLENVIKLSNAIKEKTKN